MKLFFHVLATLAVVEGRGAVMVPGGGGGGSSTTRANAITCDNAGGTGGKPFDDKSLVSDGQTMSEIKLCSDERLDGIGYTIAPKGKPSKDIFHGSKKKCNVIPLAENDYITSYELHIANMHNPGYKRIGYIKVTTANKKVHEAGKVKKQSDNSVVCTAPAGQQLGGFSGSAGQEVDVLTPIWTPI